VQEALGAAGLGLNGGVLGHLSQLVAGILLEERGICTPSSTATYGSEGQTWGRVSQKKRPLRAS
jgi:hypothetical protein